MSVHELKTLSVVSPTSIPPHLKRWNRNRQRFTSWSPAPELMREGYITCSGVRCSPPKKAFVSLCPRSSPRKLFPMFSPLWSLYVPFVSLLSCRFVGLAPKIWALIVSQSVSLIVSCRCLALVGLEQSKSISPLVTYYWFHLGVSVRHEMDTLCQCIQFGIQPGGNQRKIPGTLLLTYHLRYPTVLHPLYIRFCSEFQDTVAQYRDIYINIIAAVLLQRYLNRSQYDYCLEVVLYACAVRV